jgi:hypothetical protein
VREQLFSISAVAVLLGFILSAQQPAPVTPAPQVASVHQTTLQQYCVTCHNNRLKSGGLAVDTLDITDLRRDAEAWESVVRKSHAIKESAIDASGRRAPRGGMAPTRN